MITTRVTTSIRLHLTIQTSTGTYLYPTAVTGGTCRSLGVSYTLRCASQKPSSTYLHSSSLSLERLLCKMPDTCTLFVTVFSYISYANTSFSICNHFLLLYKTAYFPRTCSN